MRLEERYKQDISVLNAWINKLEDRKPELMAYFIDDNDELVEKVVLEIGKTDPPPDLDKLIELERQQLISLYETSSRELKLASGLNITIDALNSVKKPQEKYEEDCKAYLEEYKYYLTKKHNRTIHDARFRILNFAIKNTGNAPAVKIVFEIKFPVELSIPSNEEWLDFIYIGEKMLPPKRPSVFTSFTEMFKPITDFSLPGYRVPGVDQVSPVRSNADGPYYSDKDNCVVLTYKIQEIMHNFEETDLDEVSFLVTDSAIDMQLVLKYKIHESTLTNPIDGKLFVEVQFTDC